MGCNGQDLNFSRGCIQEKSNWINWNKFMCSLRFVWIISKTSLVVTVSPFAVIEFRITEAATRVHQIHYKATYKKREEPKCPSFLFSYFLFATGNKSGVYICMWKAVRQKVKTFRKVGGCQFSYLWPCPWGNSVPIVSCLLNSPMFWAASWWYWTFFAIKNPMKIWI